MFFYSNKVKCSAIYFETKLKKPKGLVIMAHGLGGIKELWIDKFANFFAEKGYQCLLFDYRNHGASGGNKRQLINAKDQLADWNNAIDFAKRKLKTDNIILFGSSFSGGHVIKLLSERKDVTAAISQCPYTDTLATIKALPARKILKFFFPVLLDLLSCLTGYHPYMIKTIGKDEKNSLIAVPDYSEYLERLPQNLDVPNLIPARTVFQFLKYSPGKYFKKINKPILVVPCLKDSLTPAYKTIKLAKQCKTAVVKGINCNHFDIYFNGFFDEACEYYLEFLDAQVH